MKNIYYLVIVTLLIFSCKKKDEKPKSLTQNTEYNPGQGWNMTWSEEFNGNSLNTEIWNYELGTGLNGWGNNELQYYRAENTLVGNGNLEITAKRENYNTSNFTSSRLTTKNKFDFRYGKIVGRLKLPEGYGIWPAFWMLGKSIQTWPACGEIDIMEMKCGEGSNGDKKVFSTCHWLNATNNHEYYGQEYIHTTNLSNDFHYYEVEWDSTKIIARFDGIQYNEMSIISPAVSELKENNFYIILNVAVGGNIFSPALTNQANVTAAFPQKMIVDWVRVYSK